MRINLAKIEGVLALPETHFFVFKEMLSKSKSIANNLSDIIEQWVDYHSIKKWPANLINLKGRLLNEVKSWEDIFRITIEEYCLSNSVDIDKVKLIIEKSPPHIYFIPQINELYPKDYCLGLIRDPRDVCASLKTRHWSTSNCYTNAKSWKIGLNNLEQIGCYIVRYEDFVSDANETLKQLFNYFNLEINHQVVIRFDKNSSGLAGNFNALEEIDRKYISKWRTILSNVDNECSIIEKVCGDKMDQYNYKREKKKFTLSDRKAYLISKLSHNLSKLK